jgi:photosystem II stability/assembly factor-like uncharacterized protein
MAVRFRWLAWVLLGSLMTGRLAAAGPHWIPVGPPAVPQAARLFLDPTDGSRQLALTASGLWRSLNAGNSWRILGSGLEVPPQTVAFDPANAGRVYVSMVAFDGSTSIRRSDDYGDHWHTLYSQAYGSSFYPQELRVDPTRPDTLYWLEQQFLKWSRDGGKTWNCYPAAGDCTSVITSVNAFAPAPDRPGTMYFSGGGWGFYITHDDGKTWSHSTLLEVEQPPDVLVATREPRTLYAWSRDPFYQGKIDPCFVRSDDEGTTWKVFLPVTQCGQPAIDPDDPGTVRIVVVADGAPQLWISRDGGDHWATAGPVPYVGDLYRTAHGRLSLVTSGHGIFQSTGDSGPWKAGNRGFLASEVTAVLPTEHGLLAAPVDQGYSAEIPAIPLLETRDDGRTWSSLPLTNPSLLAADPSDPAHLIAAARRYELPYLLHERVLESRDAGASWRGVVDPRVELPQFKTLAIDPFDGRTFYAGTQFQGFYRSTDGGRTWQASNSGLRFGGCHHYYCDTNWIHAILADPHQQGRLFIHFERQVYESLDGGANWTLRGPALPRSGRIYLLAADPQGDLVAVGTGTQRNDPSSMGVVYRSANGGRTWTRAGRLPKLTIPGNVPDLTSLVATRSGLFVSAIPYGVLWSADGGKAWTFLNDGLPVPMVTSLTADPFDPARLYATVTGNGVYSIRVP